ncbi:Zinc/iron permease [Ascobolus immersus RN42]|uniref:Zinc/iron permease n=1 Tax=Ascobolus immersus RN42 TaxID=1160509 RepID=A0A3N4I9J3_ASCIM|nr:Zinc/iron permease [Ascobolus immersus RN42]
MDGLLTLLLFSAAMAVASFAAGMLPLAVNLSPKHLRIMSTIGTGILVGTSLIVIIPEGIEAIYSAKSPSPPTTTSDPDHDDDHDSNHLAVGLSLITGFLLMFLIDRLSHSPHPDQQYHIPLDNIPTSPRTPSSARPPPPAPPPPRPPPHTPPLLPPLDPANHHHPPTTSSKPAATTTGLVIHACADGIALGASSKSSNVGLEAVIFLAIIIHKMPAAFGLTAVLLRGGLSKQQARRHLAVFSLAAPFGALVTWAIIMVLGGVAEGGSGMDWWTGVLLLFSGGTFLFVAVHAMQEDEGMSDDGEVKGWVHTACAAGGMLIPLLTQVGGHGH